MSLVRAAVGIAAGVLLYEAFRRWQDSQHVGSFAPASPAPDWLPAPLYDAIATGVGAIMPMTVSDKGRAFIKSNEGFKLEPYGDADGQSIYWGHHIRPGETFAHTTQDAEAVFSRDIATVEATIAGVVRVPLSQGQYDALADLVYNIGGPRFLKSTLLSKLNARDYAGAAAQFSRWIYSMGRVVPGLQDRRAAEEQLFGGVGVG